jgi:hypothetical protein
MDWRSGLGEDVPALETRRKRRRRKRRRWNSE